MSARWRNSAILAGGRTSRQSPRTKARDQRSLSVSETAATSTAVATNPWTRALVTPPRREARVTHPMSPLMPMPKARVEANPRTGRKTKPVRTAPNTVPTVLTANTRPTDPPVVRKSDVTTRLANGSVIPRHTAGTKSTLKQISTWTSSYNG